MKAKCQNLILDGENVRFCKRDATHEVVEKACSHAPEKRVETLCAPHAARLMKRNAVGPDVMIRRIT